MAGNFVVLMCAVADGFLFYTLAQFARELRKGRFARAVKAVIPVVMPARAKAAAEERRSVIDITSGSYWSPQNPRRSSAS